MSITIYSKPNCVFCDKAKAMVKSLNLDYEEKMFGKDFNTVEELYEAVGKQVRTMPQILIDGKLIGGYNQLVEHFADKLHGEMNKRTDLYITEIGKEGNKEVASKIEEVIVNVVKQTKIQGYEMWEKAVYETPNGQYRVYVGLKMGVGDANKLAEYIAKHANHDINVDELAKAAVESVIVEKVD